MRIAVNLALLERVSHPLREFDGEVGEYRSCSHECTEPFQNPKTGVSGHTWRTTGQQLPPAQILSNPADSVMTASRNNDNGNYPACLYQPNDYAYWAFLSYSLQ